MMFSNNPFCLFHLKCGAAAHDIGSASDKMYFTLGSDVCSRVRGELADPESRLRAELDWFVGADQETVNRICSDIEAGRAVSYDGLFPISALNAAVYNLSIADKSDTEALKKAVLDIDALYSGIDAANLTEAINRDRIAAGIASADSAAVAREMENKRVRIKAGITDAILSSGRDAYTAIVTAAAEKCAEDGGAHPVLSDVIDAYAEKTNPIAAEQAALIKARIEVIKTFSDEEQIMNGVGSLLDEVREWDKTVQPLQLRSKAAHEKHEPTEQLGCDLRDLSLYLNNEKGCTKASLLLVDALKGVFAESEEYYGQFGLDSETLNDILLGDSVPPELQKELDDMVSEAEMLKTSAKSTDVNDYLARVKILNANIKNAKTGVQTKTSLREKLCFATRDLSIELNNGKAMTGSAFIIANALVAEFGDLPSAREILRADLSALLKARYPSRTFEEAAPVNKKRNTRILLIVLAAIFLMATVILMTAMFSKTTSVTKSNFNQYFTIETSGDYSNGMITVFYTIKPKSDAYAKNENSSDTITVELSAAASNYQKYTGDLKYNATHKVTLKKSENYTESGSFSFEYSAGSYAFSIYWQTDVTGCSGKIGKENK